MISNVGILFFQELVPGQPGLATAIYTNATNLGNLLGYFCFSALAERLGHRRLFIASAVLTIDRVGSADWSATTGRRIAGAAVSSSPSAVLSPSWPSFNYPAVSFKAFVAWATW